MTKKRGRPSSYKEEYAEQAYRLCLLGATNEELANAFNTSTPTLNNWMHTNEAFLNAIRKGKEEADARVAESLFQRALGKTTVERKTSPDGSVSTVERDLPADTAAAIFWLKNRTRSREQPWSDKIEVERNDTLTINHIDSRELARRTLSLLDIAKREGSVVDVPLAHQLTQDAED